MNTTYPVRLLGNATPWFDDVLRDFGEIFPTSARTKGDVSWFGVDLIDKGDGYLVKANLPGVKKEDVEISLDGKRLTIRAVQQEEKEEKDEGRVLHRERYFETSVRTIELPTRPSEKVMAALDNGVLSITLGKDETNGTKKIAVK